MTRIVLAESSGREPVGRAEGGGVGQGRVAGEQLVVDAERLERRDEPVTAVRIVRGDVDARGRALRHGGSVRCGGCASLRPRPMPRGSTRHGPPTTTPTDEPHTMASPTARPDLDAYLAGFDWHPEPELIGYRDEGASRVAMERLGRDDLAGGARLRLRHRGRASDGRRVAVRRGPTPLLRPVGRWPSPRPTGPHDGRRGHRRVPGTAGGRAHEQPASTAVRLLHAAAAADVDHGRDPRAGRQPGHRRVARRPVRGLRRGGGRALVVRPRRLRRARLRPADERRRDGQLHGDDAGPRPAPRAAARTRRPAAGQGPRGRPGLHQRSDPLLDRSRPR